MKKVVALTLGFIVSSSLYILVSTLLFDNSVERSVPPAFTCGVGTMAIIALFFNKRKLQPIPVRVKKH